MRIVSNKISDLIDFYKTELKAIYDKNEINFVINQCFSQLINISGADLISKKETSLNESDLIKLYDCCLELKTNKPLQYVLGETRFFNLPFKVNSSVLIPRPETEELTEIIVNENKTKQTLRVLDIGTGSACIAVSIKKYLSAASVYAIDVSHEALKQAEQNAVLNNVEVYFKCVDILKEKPSFVNGGFDVIVSNPPYISKSEAESMHDRVKFFEPETALFVEGLNPILFYNRIIDLCKESLNVGGTLYFELNPLYADDVKNAAESSGIFVFCEIRKDLSGNNRFLIVKK